MGIEVSTIDGSDQFLKARRKKLTGEAKWKDIEDLINRWARRNPQKAIELEAYVREVREGLNDKKFGKSGVEGMGRMGLALDTELEQYIKFFYPDFMSTKDEMHEFMRRFPKFTIPERI